ncbi:hypothetical protein MCOR31_003613 [Pyricularia oryzae]|nr:hypothetical protein MCOR30_001812 [Pyricularia oryzae]KAI6372622.1 hypothetical protein MCOR31_003613 [Pyricularia oryzae]KAI6430939.1 hypothetical protein MCOR24_001744 [Pyricularia oryzae]KAI6432490.1 hypothetical protein MCOR21_003371 [Pyricularia oryzae]
MFIMTIRPLPAPASPQEASDVSHPAEQAMHDNTSDLSTLAYFLGGSHQYPPGTTAPDQDYAATWCPRLMPVQAPIMPWPSSGQQQCESPLDIVHEGEVSYEFPTPTPTSAHEYTYHSNPHPNIQTSRRGSNPRISTRPSNSTVPSPLTNTSPQSFGKPPKRSSSTERRDSSSRSAKRSRRCNTTGTISSNKNSSTGCDATTDPSSSSQRKRRRFACPYKVYEPHLSCFLEGRRNQSGGCESIYRLKQHFKRVHKRTFRCERCWKHEETLRGLDEHRAANACQPKDLAATERFMDEEHEALVDAPLGNRSEEEYWWDMFTMLIPGMAEADPGWMRVRYSPYHQDARTTQNITAQLLPNLGGIDTALATPAMLGESTFSSGMPGETASMKGVFDSNAESTASFLGLGTLATETPLFPSFPAASAATTALTSPARSLGHSPHLQWAQQAIGEQSSPALPPHVQGDFHFADNDDAIKQQQQQQQHSEDEMEAGRQAAYQRIQGLLVAALAGEMPGRARALVAQAVRELDGIQVGNGG